jgi:hypothetical protein
LLAGRTAGPIFLADRRAPAAGRRAAALSDICPDTGRGWLSYPRAEYLFKQASQLHDPHGARSWRPPLPGQPAPSHREPANRSGVPVQVSRGRRRPIERRRGSGLPLRSATALGWHALPPPWRHQTTWCKPGVFVTALRYACRECQPSLIHSAREDDRDV